MGWRWGIRHSLDGTCIEPGFLEPGDDFLDGGWVVAGAGAGAGAGAPIHPLGSSYPRLGSDGDVGGPDWGDWSGRVGLRGCTRTGGTAPTGGNGYVTLGGTRS